MGRGGADLLSALEAEGNDLRELKGARRACGDVRALSLESKRTCTHSLPRRSVAPEVPDCGLRRGSCVGIPPREVSGALAGAGMGVYVTRSTRKKDLANSTKKKYFLQAKGRANVALLRVDTDVETSTHLLSFSLSLPSYSVLITFVISFFSLPPTQIQFRPLRTLCEREE